MQFNRICKINVNEISHMKITIGNKTHSYGFVDVQRSKSDKNDDKQNNELQMEIVKS